MPRSIPVLLSSALLIALAPTTAFTQDATKAAAEAQKQIGEYQKQLAGGTDLQKHLRLDKFEAAGDTVKVTGVFLDTPATKADDPVPFDQVTDELFKSIREALKMPTLKFDKSGITRVPPEQHPHVLVQLAANAAGAKGDAGADRAVYTDSQITANGGLSVVGLRTKAGDAFGWMAREPKTLLEKHPAATRPNGTGSVAYNLKPIDWKVSAAEVQKILAAFGDPNGTQDEKDQLSVRRLWVERIYFTYQIAKEEGKPANVSLRYRVEGVRIGEAEVKIAPAQDAINRLAAELVGKPVPGDFGPLVGVVIEEPVKQIAAVVASKPSLDGVRIDSGFTFGPEGELQPAGIQPGLTAEGRKELEAIIQAGFETHGKNKPLADRYARVAKRPVGLKGMTALPLGKVLTDMRSWAVRSKDDLKLTRLYFPENLNAIQKRQFVEEGGLVLLYRVANVADIKEVEAEFRRLLKVHVENGIPQPPGAAKSDGGAAQPGMQKEPLLPGLTAYLRKEMAGDQKKWNGVLIERGYFDKDNHYTILGVVDNAKQNDDLANLLDGMKDDPKWAEYFSPPPKKPELTVIPMKEMLDRVKRVTPAYPIFDGLRIESARYDANVNLIFDSHIVGDLDRDATAFLAKLIRDSERFARRAPADKQVAISKLAGPPYSDEQLANFGLAYGAKLLSKASSSQADKDKAKQWLDMAVLHYPNESAVWFLSAYYNHAIAPDAELVRRDLYRTVGQEGTLAFNGPAQRKRRYDAAKDLQGTVRNELESLWLECFREVKDGAKPITMTKK